MMIDERMPAGSETPSPEESKATLRILLADDHDVVRRGLRQLLDEREGWEVCGEALTGRKAVQMATELKPHIAIVDLSMPELNGIEATRQIRRALPDTEILVYTMHDSEELVRKALAAGARGYLLKSDASRYLITAIEMLADHKPFFSGNVSETVLSGFLRAAESKEGDASSSPLTPRETEIIQLLAEGKSNKKISELLRISVKTVEAHRATIMRKLQVNTVVDLVRYAFRNQIAQP
jgi:DNA-binding NarL/FixJ family response regulator